MDFSCVYVQYLVLKFILASIVERPTSGPFTEIPGGRRPFRYGDTVTHNCIIVGGKPEPDIRWICILPPDKEIKFQSGRKFVKQISIRLNETNGYYDCGCHVTHPTWDSEKIVQSIPILIKTAPKLGPFRQVYSAESGKPVTIKIDYYAYPTRVGVDVNKQDYTHIVSDNVTRVFKERQNLHFVAIGQSFQADGESVYWRTSSFNESDYGPYVVLLDNDEGNTTIHFNITRKDAPSEPLNVGIQDIRSGGFSPTLYGGTNFLFSGAPSEPYNVSIDDITSEGFTLFFTPGYNGGYPQTFTLVHWPVNRRSDIGRITVSSDTIHVRYLTSETNYSLLLYAENEIERSVQSHIGPWFVKTKVGVGDGSHSLIHILYGTGVLCVVSLVLFFAIAILTCRRRRETAIGDKSNSHWSQTATLNTDRAVYVDRAVYRRTEGLPDADTVDRLSTRPKPKRSIKVSPILAVFRKSRALPDANVLSDVHDAVSRSSSNVTNGNVNGQTEDQVQLSSSSTRQLNYPHIEIRNIERRSPPTIPRRQRTNYSQINFDARVPTVVEDDSNDGSRSDYGTIFFESTAMPPPASSDDYMNV